MRVMWTIRRFATKLSLFVVDGGGDDDDDIGPTPPAYTVDGKMEKIQDFN